MADLLRVNVSLGESSFRQTTVLDGVAYVLAFEWVGRMSTWFLSLETSGGDVLFAGAPLVERSDVLGHYRASDSRIPPGTLFVLGTPTYSDLGLYYATPGDS